MHARMGPKSRRCVSLLMLMLLLGTQSAMASTSAGATRSKEEGGESLSYHDPKYTIKFHPADAPYLPEPDQEVVTMTKGNGQKFSCALPQAEALQKSEGKQNGTNVPADHKSTRKTPEDLLDFLKDTVCILRSEGWWSYEFCYKKHFRQFHLEKDLSRKAIIVTQEYSLGTYDAEATAALHKKSADGFVQPDPRSEFAAQRYHAHILSNGTKCDITNQPRETEVRFVCAEDQAFSILSIKEAPTCKYTVVINVPRLCEHPLFYQERQPWLEINCNALPYIHDDSDYESNVDGAHTLVPLGESVSRL